MKYPIKKQIGDALLEALISIVLMAIIVLGVAFIGGQAARNLAETKSNIFVVNQLKQKLATLTRDDICNGAGAGNFAMPNGTEIEISESNCNTPIAITINAQKNNIDVTGVNAPTSMDAPIVFAASINGLEYRVGGVVRGAP
ncbi:PulJ/GspJ family protein [Marinicellulosiphila megalodicopiae]|uniref:PulJ/GspJ family protein n=1 Tax=Marinicellulosiphila megalodicopiae TaxID=2724896 RepID=UPI003BAEEC05